MPSILPARMLCVPQDFSLINSVEKGWEPMLLALEQWFSTFFRLRHLLTHNFVCDTQMFISYKTTKIDLQ